MRGVEIAINYDTQLLNTDSNGVLLGPLWEGTDAEVVANVNDATGSIVAWIFASEGLEAGSGSLLQVRFDANSEAPVGTATSIDLARVRMNEGEIVANPILCRGVTAPTGRSRSWPSREQPGCRELSTRMSTRTTSQIPPRVSRAYGSC